MADTVRTRGGAAVRTCPVTSPLREIRRPRVGVYDRLFVPSASPCPRCGSQEELVIQFHFGDV